MSQVITSMGGDIGQEKVKSTVWQSRDSQEFSCQACAHEPGSSTTLLCGRAFPTRCQKQGCILILESSEGWLLLLCDKLKEKKENSPQQVGTLDPVIECLSSEEWPDIKTKGYNYRDRNVKVMREARKNWEEMKVKHRLNYFSISILVRPDWRIQGRAVLQPSTLAKLVLNNRRQHEIEMGGHQYILFRSHLSLGTRILY